MKSIIQNEKKCFICGKTYNVEEHHCIGGTARRKLSEHDGLKVYLCPLHHRGNKGVHQDRELDLWLKKIAQAKYEETHTREEFIQRYRRNYLDD